MPDYDSTNYLVCSLKIVGEILFDGKPLRMIPRLMMANSLAMVDQDILMFEGTIQDNLTLWDDLTESEDVLTAPVWLVATPEGKLIGQEPAQRQPLLRPTPAEAP